MVKFSNKIIVKLKGFSPRSSVCMARKRKSNISVHLYLTKRRYLLLKDAYNKVKDDNRIDFVCVDIRCSLRLRLKNSKSKFLTPSKSLDSCCWIWIDFSLNIGIAFRAQLNISDRFFCYVSRGLCSGCLIRFRIRLFIFFFFFELTISLSEVYKISTSHQS